MKRVLTTLLAFYIICMIYIAQNVDLNNNSNPASTNAPGLEYPGIDLNLESYFV